MFHNSSIWLFILKFIYLFIFNLLHFKAPQPVFSSSASCSFGTLKVSHVSLDSHVVMIL